MKHTHLSHALLAAAQNSNTKALALEAGVSPSTLSRLISTDRRIDESTLQKLCRPSLTNGLHILLAHLRDEIERAGRSQLEVRIVEAAASDIDIDDIGLLESQSRHDMELRAIIHDLAQLVRSIHRKENYYPVNHNQQDRKVAEDKS